MHSNHVEISPVNQDCINVIQFTDPHICPATKQFKGLDTVATLESIIEMINREQDIPDLILATGDLVHEADDESYSKLRGIMQQSKFPIFCLPGNHDKPALMETILKSEGISTSKLIGCGLWQFILLDTVLENSANGYLREEELDFLQHHLQRSSSQHIFVCLHHPPVNIGSPWMDEMKISNGDEFLAIIRKFTQIKCVLWGHIHQDFSSQLGHIQLIGSPSTCIQFKPNTEQFEKDVLPPGYRKLKLYSDGRITSSLHWLDISLQHDSVSW